MGHINIIHSSTFSSHNYVGGSLWMVRSHFLKWHVEDNYLHTIWDLLSVTFKYQYSFTDFHHSKFEEEWKDISTKWHAGDVKCSTIFRAVVGQGFTNFPTVPELLIALWHILDYHSQQNSSYYSSVSKDQARSEPDQEVMLLTFVKLISSIHQRHCRCKH